MTRLFTHMLGGVWWCNAGWSLDAISKVLYPDGVYANTGCTLLTSRQEKNFIDLCIAKNRAKKPLDRTAMRRQVQILLKEQHRRNQDVRYTPRPLTPTGKAIVKQSSTQPHLPSNDWFIKLFKRHPEAGEGSVTAKDVDRTRCTDPEFLADDLGQLHQDLYDAGKVEKDGKWKRHPGPENDDKLGRGPGYMSRAGVFQCDEKGQFFFYNVETGRLSRKKYAHASNEPAVVTVVENRTCFTYVPWADMNGDFLFAQVTFVGAGVCASHLCEGLDDCLLLQYNDKGQQDGDTYAQALEHLNKVLKLKHEDHPLVCGPGVIRVNTTDGHYSRKELKTLLASLETLIHVQIRRGGGSFITQMWDQMFNKFGETYQKLLFSLKAVFDYDKTDPHAQFKMNIKCVLSMLCQMHPNGQMVWATKGDVCEALAKVGLPLYGIDLTLLLSNPLVNKPTTLDTTSPHQSACAAQTPRAQVPPRPETFSSPKHAAGMRRGSQEHLKRKLEFTEKRLASYLSSPEDIAEAQVRMSQPSAYEEAMGRDMLSRINDGDNGSRKKLKLDLKTVYGNVSTNTELLKVRREARKQQELDREKETDKSEKARVLRHQYTLCSALNAVCSCGCDPCVVATYKYCAQCDKSGRYPLLKSSCSKQKCIQERLEAAGDADAGPDANAVSSE